MQLVTFKFILNLFSLNFVFLGPHTFFHRVYFLLIFIYLFLQFYFIILN